MTILKGRGFPTYDLLLKFFNDPTVDGALNADFAKLPSQVLNPQYVEGLWYLFYTGSDSAGP